MVAMVTTVPVSRMMIGRMVSTNNVNCVFQPTRAFQNIRIIRIAISFTVDGNLTKPIPTVHVCLTLPLYIIAI